MNELNINVVYSAKSFQLYPLRTTELFFPFFLNLRKLVDFLREGEYCIKYFPCFKLCFEEFTESSLFLQHTLEGVKSKKVLFSAFQLPLVLFRNSFSW